MNSLKQYALTGIGFLFFVLVISLTQPRPSQAGPDHNVTVDNTTANPVPSSLVGTPAVSLDPHLTHMGHLPVDHVLLTLDANGLFNYDTSAGIVYPFAVPANRALVVTDIEAVFTGLATPQQFQLAYVQLPGNLLYYTPFITLVTPDANGNAVFREHLTSGFVIPTGLSPRVTSGVQPSTLIVRGYLVQTS